MSDLNSKIEAIAQIIDGRVDQEQTRVAVSIKGIVLGFPATIEALQPTWPFGCMYTIETKVIVDPMRQTDQGFKMSIYPRVGRGIMGLLTKILLFESKGTPIGDRKLESKFNFGVDNQSEGERFIRTTGVAEHINALEEIAKFSEIVIKSDAGIYLAQPTSFNAYF
jgi:hypothetical protein